MDDVPDGRARHEVRELGRARRARALLEDAVHERRGAVDVAERAAEHQPGPRRELRGGLAERALDAHRSEPRGAIEAPRARRVEVRVGIDGRRRRSRRLRGARRTPRLPEQTARSEHRCAGAPTDARSEAPARCDEPALRAMPRAPFRARARRGRAPCPCRRSRTRSTARRARAGHLRAPVRHVHEAQRGVGLVEPRRRHQRAAAATTSAVMAASMAPAAPSVWPICALLLETGMRAISAPSARASAAASIGVVERRARCRAR